MLVCLDSSIIIVWMQGKKESNNTEIYDDVLDIIGEVSKPVFPHKSGKNAIRAIASQMLMKELFWEHYKHTRSYDEFERLGIPIMRSDDRVREWTDKFIQLGFFDDADAEHVATSVRYECDYFLTLDKGILKHKNAVLEMTEGKTMIIKPPLPGVF